jgi:ribonucleoside-diphosphate reductase subunit M2
LTACFHSINQAQGLVFRFCDEIQAPEARCFFGFQQMQENIHSELFAIMIEHFTCGQEEMCQDTAVLIREMNSVSRKQAWVMKYLSDSDAPFGVRLHSLIISSSIFDTTIFSLVFYLARNNLMPGFVKAVAKVRQDREAFTAFYLRLLSHMVNKPDESLVRQMVSEAVLIEHESVSDFKKMSSSKLSFGELAVSFEELRVRCSCTGDHVLNMLGFKGMYGAKDQLDWIDQIYEKAINRRNNKMEEIVKNTPKKFEEKTEFTIDADF